MENLSIIWVDVGVLEGFPEKEYLRNEQELARQRQLRSKGNDNEALVKRTRASKAEPKEQLRGSMQPERRHTQFVQGSLYPAW